MSMSDSRVIEALAESLYDRAMSRGAVPVCPWRELSGGVQLTFRENARAWWNDHGPAVRKGLQGG